MNAKDYIWIERYLDGLLSNEERLAFEKRLTSDVDLHKEFELEKKLRSTLTHTKTDTKDIEDSKIQKYRDALEEGDLKALRKTVLEVNSDFSSEPKKARAVWYFVAAASIAALLIIQLFFQQNVSNIELYYDNVDLQGLPSFTIRNTQNQLESKMIEGEQEFKKGNFQEALNIFNSVPKDTKNNMLLSIYIGVSQIELGLYRQAEDTFDSLLSNEERHDGHIALWYKALLYLKQGDDVKVLEQLKLISQDDNNPYHSKAHDLIRAIHKLD